jgi:hypothetical protein
MMGMAVRGAKRLWAATATAGALLVPAIVRAQEHPPPDPNPFVDRQAFELTGGVATFYPKLANVAFSGTGHPPDGSPAIDYNHRGREIGLDSPSIWAFQMELHARIRWFSAGLTGFIGGHPGTGDASPNPPGNAAAPLANTGSIVAYGAGLDLAAAVPIGRFVSVRLGNVVGIRGFSLGLTGVPDKCGEDDNSTSCHATAYADPQVFLQPRIRVLVRQPHADGFFYGVSAGDEIVGGGFAASFFIGWTTTDL